MSELLPSELARLILGYFETNGYTKTVETMLNELPELSEINQRKKKGRKVNLRVGDLCLTDMLDDYAISKDIIHETTTKYPSTFYAVKKIQLLSEQIKSLIDIILTNKVYKVYPKSIHPRSSTAFVSPKLEMSSSSIILPNNISINVGNYEQMECSSEKSNEIDTTPISSLPGSLRQDNEIPNVAERKGEQDKIEESNQEFSIDSTPQKRKGSLRKKTQPSPKLCSKSGLLNEPDERMQKLIKNLIENTVLHTKIADSINSTLFMSNEETGGTNKPVAPSQPVNDTTMSQPKDEIQLETQPKLNNTQVQTSSPSFVPDSDISSGSKTNLPENIISNLSLQVTNDPMMESILASIDFESQGLSNRLLSTPVPSMSPSHSNFSSCNVYSSLQQSTSMQDSLAQPLNNSSNFTVENCFKGKENPLDANKSQSSSMQLLESFSNQNLNSLNKYRNLSLEECLGNQKIQAEKANPLTFEECFGTQTISKSSVAGNITLVECFRRQDEKISDGSHGVEPVENKTFELEENNLVSEKCFLISDRDTSDKSNSFKDLRENYAFCSDGNGIDKLVKDKNLSETNSIATCEKPKNPADSSLSTTNFDTDAVNLQNENVPVSSPRPILRENKLAEKNLEQQCLEEYIPKDNEPPDSSTKEVLKKLQIPEIFDTGQLHSEKDVQDLVCFNKNKANLESSSENQLEIASLSTSDHNKEVVGFCSKSPMQANLCHKSVNNNKKYRVKVNFVSHNMVQEITDIKDTYACMPDNGSKDSVEHSVKEFTWPRTQSLYGQSQLPQNYSPMHPPSIQAIPVMNSNEVFFNSKYISGTPEHSNNYTLTELTPLPISPQKWGIKSTSPALSSQDTSVSPLAQVMVPVNAASNLNTDGNHIIVLSEQPVIMHGTVITSEFGPQQQAGIQTKEVEVGRIIEVPTETQDSQIPNYKARSEATSVENVELQHEDCHSNSQQSKNNEGIADTLANNLDTSSPCRKLTDDNEGKLKKNNKIIQKKQSKTYVSKINKKTKKTTKNFKSKNLYSEGNDIVSEYQDEKKLSNESSDASISNINKSDDKRIMENDTELNSENTLLKLVDEIECKDVNDIRIPDNIPHSDVLKIQVDENMIGAKNINEPEGNKNSHNTGNCRSRELESLSPGLKSLVLFSDSFKLHSNVKHYNRSPSSNERIRKYKGSLSTPRNRSSHIRALDFSTPKKLFHSKKKSPKARANLLFSSPSPSKKVSPPQKKTKKVRARLSSMQSIPMEVILESSKEEVPSENSFKELSIDEKQKSVNNVTNLEIRDLEEDLFMSEDESHGSTTTTVLDKTLSQIIQESQDLPLNKTLALETPGKNCVPVCLEPTTPFPLKSVIKNNSVSTGKELHTPVVPGVPSTPKYKSPYLKAYPQGPYSNSTTESSYYQPSERSVTDSPSYSPFQDDIESILIKTAQGSEMDMKNLTPNVDILKDTTEIGEIERDLLESNSEQNLEQKKTEVSNKSKYNSRQLSNEELVKAVQQEKEVLKQMKEVARKSNSQNKHKSCKENIAHEDDNNNNSNKEEKRNSKSNLRRKSSRINAKQINSTHKKLPKTQQNTREEVKSTRGKKAQHVNGKFMEGKLSFEEFGFDFKLLTTHTLDILRNSHIESAKPILQELEQLLEKEKYHDSGYDKEEKIESLISMIKYFGTPYIVQKLKKKLKRLSLKKIQSQSGGEVGNQNKTEEMLQYSPSDHCSSNNSQKKDSRKTKDFLKNVNTVDTLHEKILDNSKEGENNNEFNKSLNNAEKSNDHLKVKLVVDQLDTSNECMEESSKIKDKKINENCKESVSGVGNPQRVEDSQSDCTSSENLNDEMALKFTKTRGNLHKYGDNFAQSENEYEEESNSFSKKEKNKNYPKSSNATSSNANLEKKRNIHKLKYINKTKGLNVSLQEPEGKFDGNLTAPNKTSKNDKSCPNDERNDEYSVIERQLAALDGSVANSPSIREDLSSNILDDENISVMFTPSSHFHEQKETVSDPQIIEELRVSFTNADASNSLMHFTPLPQTPEKDVEEMCQQIVKNKLGFVAFPQYGTKSELSSNIRRHNQNIDKSFCCNEEKSGNECIVISDSSNADDNDNDGTFCSLSFSDTFDLLTLNLVENAKKVYHKSKIFPKNNTKDSVEFEGNNLLCYSQNKSPIDLDSSKCSKKNRTLKVQEKEIEHTGQKRITRSRKRKVEEVKQTDVCDSDSKAKKKKVSNEQQLEYLKSGSGKGPRGKSSKTNKGNITPQKKTKSVVKDLSDKKKPKSVKASKLKDEDNIKKKSSSNVAPKKNVKGKNSDINQKGKGKKNSLDKAQKLESKSPDKLPFPDGIKEKTKSKTGNKRHKEPGFKKNPTKETFNERASLREEKDDEDAGSLKELQLSFSDAEECSDITEDRAFNQSEISKSLLKGGNSYVSDSPTEAQTPISKLRSQDTYLHYTEESMFSIPPTPGKHLFLPPNGMEGDFYESSFSYQPTTSGCRSSLFAANSSRTTQFSTPRKKVLQSPKVPSAKKATLRTTELSKLSASNLKEVKTLDANRGPIEGEKKKVVDQRIDNQKSPPSSVLKESEPLKTKKSTESSSLTLCDSLLVGEAAVKLTEDETKNIKKILQLMKKKV